MVGAGAIHASNHQATIARHDDSPSRPFSANSGSTRERPIREGRASDTETIHLNSTTPPLNKARRRWKETKVWDTMLKEWVRGSRDSLSNAENTMVLAAHANVNSGLAAAAPMI